MNHFLMFGDRLLVKFACQYLNIFVVHVRTELEVPMVELLQCRALLLLTNLDQIFDILN